MIYELAVVIHPSSGEQGVESTKALIEESLTQFKGEVIVNDDWGIREFGQPKNDGLTKGQYLYYIYRGDGDSNRELERRFKISESVVNHLFVKLGEDAELEDVKKKYEHPFKYSEDEARKSPRDLIKDRKMFARRKSCWFTANKTEPDWKDPMSYAWLVSEFGKISPARVSGISRKMQRRATATIKRARAIGLISYMSNRTAR
jgi:small subunit ribosomal protein S6